LPTSAFIASESDKLFVAFNPHTIAGGQMKDNRSLTVDQIKKNTKQNSLTGNFVQITWATSVQIKDKI